MADRVSARRRERKLASYHRRVAERRERGLCIKCGKRPPAPERSIRACCGEKAGAAERARAARLRAEDKLVRDPEARRRADRERDRRQHAERRAAGLCVKCGRAPALPERTQCGPCAERRLAADRARHARARAEGKPRRDSEAARPCYPAGPKRRSKPTPRAIDQDWGWPNLLTHRLPRPRPLRRRAAGAAPFPATPKSPIPIRCLPLRRSVPPRAAPPREERK